MLILYDQNKNKLRGLLNYKDLCITSTLKTGDKTIEFSYPQKDSADFVAEGYIRTKTDEFVIKTIDSSSDYVKIKGTLNVEELEGNSFRSVEYETADLESIMSLLLSPTRWTYRVDKNIKKKRTITATNSSVWDILQDIIKTFLVEIEFDTINKVVIVKEQVGQDKGVYFIEDLNLKNLSINNDSYDFFTRIIPIMKDNETTIFEETGGNYLENHTFSNKIKTLIWKDERYTDWQSMKEDAIKKLAEISKPRIAYEIDVIDLAKISDNYSSLDYKIGDTIHLISKSKKVKDKQRIVKIKEYPDNPNKNTCEVSNTIFEFEDTLKVANENNKIINNITATNGTISEGAISNAIEKLSLGTANIKLLNALEIRVGAIEGSIGNFTDLSSVNAEIQNLKTSKADIEDLNAENIEFRTASGEVLDIQTILSNFTFGENATYLHLTGTNAVIDNAVIKDAMIQNVSADKLTTGTLNTKNINIASDDNSMKISDGTIQFNDSEGRPRLQIGEDSNGDFNIVLTDDKGTTLINSEGIQEGAIADNFIKTDMIDTNAITSDKIDYNSLITGLNEKNTGKFIKASKVQVDGVGQTLEVAFNSLENDVNGLQEQTQTNTTAINVANGNINTLVSETNTIKNNVTKNAEQISTNKSSIDQLKNKIELKVDTSTFNNGIANLSNTYATKSSLTLTENKLIADFKSTGGFNLIRNSSGQGGVNCWRKGGDLTLVSTKSNNMYFKNPCYMYAEGKDTQTGKLYAYSQRFKLKANTKYTLSGYFHNYTKCKSFTVYVLASTSLAESDTALTYDLSHKIFSEENTSGQWLKFVGSFTTGKATSGFLRIDHNGYNSSGTNQSRVHWADLMLSEGEEQQWTPHPSEIYDGNTIIDANGVTINNGALTVKNKSGVAQLVGDSNGNLTMKGSLDITINNDNKETVIVRHENANLNRPYIAITSGRAGAFFGGGITVADDYSKFVNNKYSTVDINSDASYIDRFNVRSNSIQANFLNIKSTANIPFSTYFQTATNGTNKVILCNRDGSNRYGYVRYFDGTQICWNSINWGEIAFMNNNATGIWNNDSSGMRYKSFTFPLAFSSEPTVHANVTSGGYTQCQVCAISTTGGAVRVWQSYPSEGVASVKLTYVAIGRWY